jgi:hypothetical protein
MNINFFNKIKLLLGITYEDPIKDEEIKILIETAKSFLLNAGWHKNNLENAQSVMATTIYIKMAQNLDVNNFINHPVITNLIMQNKEEEKREDGGTIINSENLNLDKIEKEIENINNSLNLILENLNDKEVIEKIEEIKDIINTNNISSTELITNIQNSINSLQNFNIEDLQSLINNLQSFITSFLLEQNNTLNDKLEIAIEGIQTINNTISNLSTSGSSSIRRIRHHSFFYARLENTASDDVKRTITFDYPIANLSKTQVICDCYTVRDNSFKYTKDSTPWEMPQPVTYNLGETSIDIVQNPLAKVERGPYELAAYSYLYGNVQIIEYN